MLHLAVGTLPFVPDSSVVEVRFYATLAAGGKLLATLRSHVVIGEGQAVGRDKRSRASVVEAHRGQAKMIEPLLGGFEAVRGLGFLRGEGIVEPHSLVRPGKGTAQNTDQQT